jgi:hypothetical protein
LGHQLSVHVNSVNVYPPDNPSVTVRRYLNYPGLLTESQFRKRLLSPGAEGLFPFWGVDVG